MFVYLPVTDILEKGRLLTPGSLDQLISQINIEKELIICVFRPTNGGDQDVVILEKEDLITCGQEHSCGNWKIKGYYALKRDLKGLQGLSIPPAPYKKEVANA